MANDRHWHALTVDEAYDALDSGPHGLTSEEAERRLAEHGPNEIQEGEGVSPWHILWQQVANPLVLVLIAAALVSILSGHLTDAAVIGAVIVLNSAIGFFQEYRAEKAIEALRSQAAPEAEVLRDCTDTGRCTELTIKTRDIVPGDVVLLEAGDRVPADARLFDARNLEVDEAMLTGESLPVAKTTDIVDPGAGTGDRLNLVYGGTIITHGRGRAVVYATGAATEFGQIAGLIQETDKAESPIQQQTLALSRWLGVLALVVSLLILGVGLLRGYGFQEVFLLALAGAVSAIPEGLPAVMTITLAVGVRRMAERNAIIRRLRAVDTLGASTAICSDKTGTLTTNKMTIEELRLWPRQERRYRVSGVGLEPEGEFTLAGEALAGEGAADEEPAGGRVDPEEDEALRLALRIGALASDARLTHHVDNGSAHWEIHGDPTEGALVVAAAKAGLHKETLEERFPREDEIPFTTEKGYMATFHRQDGHGWVFVKGKPETMLSLSSEILRGGETGPLTDDVREAVREANEAMAGQALRVLGLAYRQVSPDGLLEAKERLEEGRQTLVFVGLAGMIDPPRPEVAEAVAVAKRAGIRVIMATGDHPLTARTIAREIGILEGNGRVIAGHDLEEMSDEALDEAIDETTVFARVSPAHKHRIVEALRGRGHVVAMTGDGINDAPALQAAEIGIAMGITGTDVTKETSDMILTDDNFASIVAAVEEGRGVFQNIRKVVKFLLTTNIGEGLTIIASLLLFPVGQTIITPVQILWVNLVTDGLLDITIALEPKEGDVMEEPPRPRTAGIVNREIVVNMVIVALFMAAGTLWMFWRANAAGDLVYARTVAFTTLAMFQVFNALNVRSRSKSVFQMGFFTNPYLLGAMALSVLLQVAANRVGFLQVVLDTSPLTLADWLPIIGVSSTVLVADEVRKVWTRRQARAAREGEGAAARG